jgi:two-component system phosphate regulon sensor histidine kinase PhoR
MAWYWDILILLVLLGATVLVVRSVLSLVVRALQSNHRISPRRNWLHRLIGLNKLEEQLDLWMRDREQQIQESESESRRLQAILEQIAEGVLLLDGEHRIVRSNRAMKALLKGSTLTPGVRLERLFSHGELLNIMRQARKSLHARGEIVIANGDEKKVLHVSGNYLAGELDEHEGGLLLTFSDITRQNQLEQVRRDFVTNISHELRTPLTIIKGYTETMMSGGESIGQDVQHRFLRKISSNAGRLQDLLEDLLELSRLEGSTQQLRCVQVSFNDWLSEVAEDFVMQSRVKRERLQLSLDSTIADVSIDPTKLSRVVENLLENAFQHSTDEDQSVQLTARREGECLSVWVCDKGKGIPKEKQAHIFERFYRADNGRDRRQGGFGLGLSIAKHVVQLHGGTIGVESNAGEGTCIHFQIPIESQIDK